MDSINSSNWRPRVWACFFSAFVAWVSYPVHASSSEVSWQQIVEEAIRSNSSMSGVTFRTKFLQFPPKVPLCLDPIVSLPQRLVGIIYVQLRCPSSRWSAHAQVLVETKRKHLALSKPLKAGAVIEEGDVVVVESDWGSPLEQTIETFEQAVGKTLTRSLLAGAPITLNSLRQTSVIKSGDRVRVLMVGKNFSVSGEGISQGNAAIGDQVKVKMNNGQSITALVVKVGVVQVNVE